MTEGKAHRICPICEAGCGLQVDRQGRQVLSVRGNDSDVFSAGHVCAKGIALTQLHDDPDRLRQPLLRQKGKLVPTDWPTAWAFIAARLQEIRERDGNQAVASYIGNPTAHNVGLSFGLGNFVQRLGSTQVYAASTVDQMPKQLASALMFGDDMAIPVPDIGRCDYLLMLGANPVVSNGSLWLVPKVREKIRDLKTRGGRFVTVDPRFTETARLADAHHFIRPGSDAWLLAALCNELALLGRALPADSGMVGRELLVNALAEISLVRAARQTGFTTDAIQALALELSAAQHPVLYGRVGTTLQRHGTLTSFLLEVIHLQLGVLDRDGGAMFPEQPYYRARADSREFPHGRWHSRVSAYPEVLGQMPVVALAEEIDTPGDGQVRALFCFAGNPVVSTPDSRRLAAALESLELLVCVDIYHNETSRLADVVLPGTSPFEEGHYDHFLGAMGYRNAARYSPPLFAPDQASEWQIGLTLAHIAATGQVPDTAELGEFEDGVVASAIGALVNDSDSGIAGADPQTIMAQIGPTEGVERLLDLGIRAGRWGDHFGARQDGLGGLTLQRLIETPDGVDLEALRAERLPELNGHPDGRIALAPSLILEALRNLEADSELSVDNDELQLIGRRNTRSNNSWLRNLPMLNRGKPLCTLLLHPVDARARLLVDGDRVRVTSETGTIVVDVEVTDSMMPGTVSLPHGFSAADNLDQKHLQAAANYNELAGASRVDRPSGTAALNGFGVTVQRLSMMD